MFWSMNRFMPKTQKVLVTGGAGFIGSHLVDKLVDKGYAVRVIDNLSTGNMANIKAHVDAGKVDFVKGDIRDVSLVKRSIKGVDLVFHLAAQTSVPFSVENPQLTYDTNVAGTLNLLASCARQKVGKFVFVSSCAVYGEPRYLPVDEKHPTNPISPYAESKLAGERYCLGFDERQLLLFGCPAFLQRLRTKTGLERLQRSNNAYLLSVLSRDCRRLCMGMVRKPEIS